MFIIKTLHGDVKIDFDELPRLAVHKGDGLIYFRNGAVNPKHVSTVVPDVERMKTIIKKPGDSKESVQKRIEEDQSEDVFATIRQSTVSIGSPVIPLLK